MFELIVLMSSIGEYMSVLCDDLHAVAREFDSLKKQGYEFVTIQQKSECRSCEALTDGKAQWCNACVQKLHDAYHEIPLSHRDLSDAEIKQIGRLPE